MSQALRILHVQAESDLAGCERTCQTFIACTQPDFESFVLLLNTPGPAVPQWEKNGANVICRPIGKGRIDTYVETYRAVRSIKPDLVILWTSMRLPLMVSACRTAGAPRCAVHIGNPIRFDRRHRLAALAYSFLPKARSASVIPASHHIAQSLADKPSYRGQGVRVCHNGIDLDRFAFKPKKNLGEPPLVGMSARLDEIKDHKTLLTAWKIVVSNRRDAKLELAGDGPLKRELELLGASLGIETSVSFLGRIGDMVNKCYAWDLIVHSTTKEEGLGNSMIEAMALGRALVATDVGPVREIAGLEDALLVPPGDPSALASAILHALENDAATKARIARARSTVELKFSSNAMVDAYLQITRCPTARSRKTHHNATAV